MTLDGERKREGGDIVFVDSENTPRERVYDIEATIEPSAESTPQNNKAMDAVNALIKAKPRASIKNTFLEGFMKLVDVVLERLNRALHRLQRQLGLRRHGSLRARVRYE